jgi:hypothetical protein
MSFGRLSRLLIISIVTITLLGRSSLPPGDPIEQVRAFTRSIEFDYVSWTLDALWVKLNQVALGTSNYMTDDARSQLVLDYLDLVGSIQNDEARLNDIYADPNISDPKTASATLKQELDSLYNLRAYMQPLAESILQTQVSTVIADLGLTLGGQPIPPILYHVTPPPYGLIISPRNIIRQDADISILPSLTVDQQAALEEKVDHALNVSSLVVGIGGVGLYPTMVMQTTDINWLTETIAHEWVHNFLTLRPLGISYLSGPELRTINETTASIAGKEIGRAVIERYYPEFLPPPPPPPAPPSESQNPPATPPAFDYQDEMHLTRITVDDLLAKSKIEDTESYMEARRRVFWEHGYHIRKINQAFFAFYGAYADQPGGAAGEDPVGAAVRTLRAKSASLADFLNRISWISSYDQLKREVR